MKTAKGHAFRRAVGGRVKKPALAAEAFNPQGLKALSYFGPLSARMNPCPFALPPSRKVEFSRRLLKLANPLTPARIDSG